MSAFDDDFDDELDALDDGDGFASQPSSTSNNAKHGDFSKPLLGVAVVGLLFGAVTAVAGGDSLALHLAGYLLGSVAPITAVAFYRREAEQASASQGLRVSKSSTYVTGALMGLGLLVAVGQAIAIAGSFAS